MNSGKTVVAVVAPDGRAARPDAAGDSRRPEVRVSMSDDKNRLRTFPSLMSTPYEFQLLEWHATGQIALIDVASGAVPSSASRA